jgi:hypothetical protein
VVYFHKNEAAGVKGECLKSISINICRSVEAPGSQKLAAVPDMAPIVVKMRFNIIGSWAQEIVSQ